jgi:hypothetical protein
MPAPATVGVRNDRNTGVLQSLLLVKDLDAIGNSYRDKVGFQG